MTQPPRRPSGRPDRPPRPNRPARLNRPTRSDTRPGARGQRPIAPGSGQDPVVAGLGPTGGETIETTIERIVPGGDGIAHGSGLTLFVPLTAPGDTVRVRLDRRRGQVAWGTATELLAPGPNRAEPPCPYYGTCGGCDLQHLTYAAQLEAKLGIVRDSLSRIARIDPPDDLAIVPSPNPLAYRFVAEWSLDGAARTMGYRQRASHMVVDVEHCPILEPQLNGTLADLREKQAMGLMPPNVNEIRGVAGDAGAGVAPALGGDYPPELSQRIGGETYRYDAACFFQANGLLLGELVSEALWQADLEQPGDAAPLAGDGPGFALDLYAGAGLFTVPLARRYRRVVAVEGYTPASRWARRNLHDAGLGHAKVDAERVENWLARRARALTGAALVVLDPPRTGVTPEALTGLLTLAPRRITYVSCDPPTQARDLKALVAGGYRLARMMALDMFPQSHHVETVAHLVRV